MDSNRQQMKKRNKNEEEKQTPLMAMNHVSRLCRNVEKSKEFYTKVLGMVLIERPESLDFEGAWLFNYGVQIHLVEAKDEDKLDRLPEPDRPLDPMDNHISFQCEDMEGLEQRLKEFNVKYSKRTLDDESGTKIDQMFFRDPDGHMIEICNCEKLKLVPASSIHKLKLPSDQHNPPIALEVDGDDPK